MTDFLSNLLFADEQFQKGAVFVSLLLFLGTETACAMEGSMRNCVISTVPIWKVQRPPFVVL